MTRNITKIQYLSDLHLEYRKVIPIVPVAADYLILAGDIGNPFKDNYYYFMNRVSRQFKKIFLIAGNHEYWNLNATGAADRYNNFVHVHDRIRTVTNNFPNIHFLNNTSHCFDDKYEILGTVLWSWVDNSSFKNLNQIYLRNREWLERELLNKKDKIVITHHLPTYSLITEQYQARKYSKYTQQFASHLDHLIQPPVKFWIAGHSHCTYETRINGVYCGINAVGYHSTEIQPKVITLD